jgi:hypothetical protein
MREFLKLAGFAVLPCTCGLVEASAFNTQTPGKYPEDNLSLLQHEESLKTRIVNLFEISQEVHTYVQLTTSLKCFYV